VDSFFTPIVFEYSGWSGQRPVGESHHAQQWNCCSILLF